VFPISNHRDIGGCVDCGEFLEILNDAVQVTQLFFGVLAPMLRDSISSELFGDAMTDATGDPVNLGEAPLNLPRTSGDEIDRRQVARVRADSGHRRNCRRMRGRFPSRPIRPRGLWSGGNSSFSCEGFFDPVEQIRFHAPIRQQYSVSRIARGRVCIPRSDLGRDAYTRFVLPLATTWTAHSK